MGIISSLGEGISKTTEALQKSLTGIRPLTLFSTASNQPLPVGEAVGPIEDASLPRTHQLARLAADQAMAKSGETPDAVVMGVTTGGMLTTEALLKKKARDPKSFCLHATGSVAEDIARRYRCTGPALTVSTACSSGAAAIKIALEMLRSGSAKRVLAGGADSLCRLTYFGFSSLQIVDPDGARPFDQNRQGMSVAEGAAMLLLVANEPHKALAEIIGAGLSCDAYHPATPHPRGQGALAAMQSAIEDAGISMADIDYVNLHGTGTLENDLAEARAIDTLYERQKPLMSSVKGAFGHSLAAAGAIEAVVSVISISNSLVPATVGCSRPDPVLKLAPVIQPTQRANRHRSLKLLRVWRQQRSGCFQCLRQTQTHQHLRQNTADGNPWKRLCNRGGRYKPNDESGRRREKRAQGCWVFGRYPQIFLPVMCVDLSGFRDWHCPWPLPPMRTRGKAMTRRRYFWAPAGEHCRKRRTF